MRTGLWRHGSQWRWEWNEISLSRTLPGYRVFMPVLRKPTGRIIGTQTEIRKVKLKIKIIFILFTFQCLCLPIIPCRLTKRVFNRKYFLPTLWSPTPVVYERKQASGIKSVEKISFVEDSVSNRSLCVLVIEERIIQNNKETVPR